MEIACQNCNSSFNLPDNRLPKDRVLSFPCPSCKSKITLDTREKPEKAAEPESDRLVFKPLADSTDASLDADDLKKKIIRKIEDLPPMPKVLLKAREVMNDPRSSFKDVAGIIETDQAIAAKVLKVANSAYYGLSGMVNSIHQATVVLGQKTLEQVITMVSSSSLLGKRLRGYDLSAGVLWRHSLAVALCSQMIAQKRAPNLENDAFSVGLIHDAGKLALDDYLYKKNKLFKDYLAKNSPSIQAAEYHVLGFDHTEIAEELCRKWKLPENHAEAMRFHHNPNESNDNTLAHIVYLANYVSNEAGFGSGRVPGETPLNESSMKTLKLKDTDIANFTQDLIAAVDEITQSLNV